MKQRSLRVLSLANCRVADARPLAVLRGLEVLDLSRNLVSELEDVFELLGGLPMLAELDMRQNPVVSMPKYRERAITFSSARLSKCWSIKWRSVRSQMITYTKRRWTDVMILNTELLDKKDMDANQRRMMQSHMAHKFRSAPHPHSSSHRRRSVLTLFLSLGRKHQEANASANSNAGASSVAVGGSVAESKRMIKHGTATHQLRSVHVTATGISKLPSGRGMRLSDGLGIAGASCAPVSSAALVRAHGNNNSRHD